MILNDNEFKGYVDLIMDLDWSHMDVVLFGGIVSPWQTKDIDCLVYGTDEERAIHNMLEMQKMGPWDPYYTRQSYMKNWHPDNGRQDFQCTKVTLYGKVSQHVWDVPFSKQQKRIELGIEYGRNIILIQNGERIYF